MATAVARIAFMGDSVGNPSSNTPKVAAAVSAAFGRFGPGASNCYCIFGGDTYSPYATTSSMLNYDQYLSKPNVAAARSVMTPGNHDNGIGGASQPSAQAWLSYNATKGTHTNVAGGWINQAEGIPNTDQFWDIGGFRFFFINSGAVVGGNSNPGWPVPHTGGSVTGNARVGWLRANWANGLRNIVVTHHPRWSYYGNHHDNPEMQNLWDEILGVNDGSGPHSSLVLSGHDHNMQLFQPRSGAGTYPGLTAAVIGLGATAPYTGAGPANQTSQKSWLQFANFTAGACGFLQIDLMDDFSIVMSVIDAADTSGALMTNTASSGVTGAATATIVTGISAPTITYQYRVDGGSWVDNSTSLTKQLTSLTPGAHVMEVKRLSGATESDVSSYAWTVPVPVNTAPVIEGVTDLFDNPVAPDSTIQSQEITFDVGRTTDIPAGTPDTSLWLYNTDFTGCTFGMAPKTADIGAGENFVAQARKFWIRTTPEGNAPFNPEGKNQAGVDQYGANITQNFFNNEVIPWMNGQNPVNHPVDFCLTVAGFRTEVDGIGNPIPDKTWPTTGWDAFRAWVPGDNSYVDQCLTRWSDLLKTLPRRTIIRLWHEFRNSTTYTCLYSDEGIGNGYTNYINMFRKVTSFWRTTGCLYDGPGSPGKHVMCWNPASKLLLDGSGHSIELWYPGTYPTQRGGCDWIGEDLYLTSGESPPYQSLSLWQGFYDAFKPGSANNPDNIPMMVCENGIYATDPSRLLHLTEWIGDGINPGLLQTNYPDVKSVVWWNGSGNELTDTPAGFQEAFRLGTTSSYFVPNNIVPATPTLMAKLDGADLGKVQSPLTLDVDPGAHTIEFWTDTSGQISDKAAFSWTVIPVQHGEGSGTYIKQIPLNKNVSTAEIWVRAVGDDGVSTVEKRNVTLNLVNPVPGTAPTLLGSAIGTTNLGTIPVTLSRAVAPGASLIVVAVSTNIAHSSIADNQGLTYTKADEVSSASFLMSLWSAPAPSGTAGAPIVTLTFGAATTRRGILVYEVPSILTSGALDQIKHANLGSGTDMSTGNTSPSAQPGTFAMAVAFASNLVDNTSWSPGVASGFQKLDTLVVGTSNIKTMATEWAWNAAPNAVFNSGQQNLVGSTAWGSIIATFKSKTGAVYEPGVGFDAPDEGAAQQTATIPVEVVTSDEVTGVQVTIDNVNFFSLTNMGVSAGIITWQGTIDIPVDGSLATITTVATSP